MASENIVRAYRALITEALPQTTPEDDEILVDTPGRMARAWEELTEGYGPTPDLRTFPAEGDGLVIQRGIIFHSLCEHHGLPFFGTIDIAYLPGERIIGLSKLPRLVKHLSRRLQVQERLTAQIADQLEKALEPEGVLVVARAQHLCMSMRGVESLGAVTVTSEARGRIRENTVTKAEVMGLLA